MAESKPTDTIPPPSPSNVYASIAPNQVETQYQVIDTDPHFFRVIRYARTSDYAVGAATAAAGPLAFLLLERLQPSFLPTPAIRSGVRVMVGIGLCAGFLRFYMRPSLRFWGWTENSREVEMDMREMVDKVKRGEPLYGTSTLSPYMQGIAARNSRYSQLFMHVIPWFNLVNHPYHGVDTAKYYRAAEEELEKERVAKESFTSY